MAKKDNEPPVEKPKPRPPPVVEKPRFVIDDILRVPALTPLPPPMDSFDSARELSRKRDNWVMEDGQEPDRGRPRRDDTTRNDRRVESPDKYQRYVPPTPSSRRRTQEIHVPRNIIGMKKSSGRKKKLNRRLHAAYNQAEDIYQCSETELDSESDDARTS